MHEYQLRDVPLKSRLQFKLNPNRFLNISPLMTAIIGHLLDVPFIRPQILEIAVTADDFVLARIEGETREQFIATYTDLVRNWGLLLASAGLTTLERMEAESLFAEKIGMFGRVMA